MFYDPDSKERALRHDPFKAIVVPRPIGWISSLDAQGRINLAPYSFFNGIASRPRLVMFSSESRKDSVSNIEATREFVCNLATWDLREAVNQSSGDYPHGINEMEKSGLTPAPSVKVRPPRVAQSPCALECKLVSVTQLRDMDGKAIDNFMVIGQVVGIYIDDRFLRDGILDTGAMHPIARCGYLGDYAKVDTMFEMFRPKV